MTREQRALLLRLVRIQGPTFLVEYDNTQDDADHVRERVTPHERGAWRIACE